MCEFIKCVFPKNINSSRLITTTRKHNVSEASCASDGDKIYEMKPLSDDDSLKLFHSRIFRRGDTCPPELEQVSRDILKKCGGVPLAIITIASLLASGKQVKTKNQWLSLRNSIGHGLKGCWRVEDMYKILSLSYYDLPSHLKPCLLYLSIFFEDYEIGKDRLIWRWIAESFIQQDHSSGYDNLFDIGESYFIELVNRSMIQPVVIDLEDGVKFCCVHDMVLDLIRSLSSKEKFVAVWDKDEQTIPLHNTELPRRLSIQNNTTTRATKTSMSKLRSFTIFNPAMDSMPSLTQFQVLRVLDLKGCDLSECGSHLKLRQVGKLSHLRYLGLAGTGICELPVEVGKLQFLQTLDLRRCYKVQELPRTVTGLQNLMCLRVWNIRLPKGLSNLTSLEELTGVRISVDDSSAVVKELGHLTRLRVLSLCWDAPDVGVGDALVQSLGNLCKLQSFHLFVCGGRGDLIHGWSPPLCFRRFYCGGPTGTLPMLPTWIKNSSSSLTLLSLTVSQVGPEDLQVLGALPLLRAVIVLVEVEGRIDDGGHPSTRMKVNSGGFPCVRSCHFSNFVTVPSMFSSGAMPLVQRLVFSIRACDFAGGAGGFGLDDLRMGHLPSLEEVQVALWYRKEDDAAVVERVEAALRQAAEDHPNRLALSIYNHKAIIRDED